MWLNIWRNRLEFYPYLTILLFWFFGAAMGSLIVQNRPGIVALGVVTNPSITLIIIAAIRTYKDCIIPDMQPVESFAPSDPVYDKKFGYYTFGLLILVILVSTYLHFFQPQVLNVPSNTDVSSWTNPTFEQTTIYDRMTEDEREKILAEGVIYGDNLPLQFLLDVFTVFMGWICFLHALRHFGFWMASCFLIGSFVFTGLEESMWILVGRFAPDSSINTLDGSVYGTYWFTKGGFWFVETPITACIGWFFIAYSCVLVAGRVFPRMNLWGRAAAGGLIAMGIDLWLDPVATSPEIMNWVWARGDVLLIFGIPHSNFVGWFLLIFLFAIFWEKLPQMEKRWGRAKATVNFFLVILVAELGILIFFGIWMTALKGILSLAVIERIHLPQGW